MQKRSIVIRSRVLIALGFVYSLLGGVALAFAEKISYAFGIQSRFTVIVGLTVLTLGSGAFLLAYLRGDFGSRSRLYGDLDATPPFYGGSYASVPDIQRFAEALDDLRDQINETKKTRLSLKELSSEERESLLSNLKTQLESVLASDLVNKIEAKYSSQIANAAQVTQIRKGIEITSLRLRTEIDALTRRGNLNLVIWNLNYYCRCRIINLSRFGSDD